MKPEKLNNLVLSQLLCLLLYNRVVSKEHSTYVSNSCVTSVVWVVKANGSYSKACKACITFEILFSPIHTLMNTCTHTHIHTWG